MNTQPQSTRECRVFRANRWANRVFLAAFHKTSFLDGLLNKHRKLTMKILKLAHEVAGGDGDGVASTNPLTSGSITSDQQHPKEENRHGRRRFSTTCQRSRSLAEKEQVAPPECGRFVGGVSERVHCLW